jgi:hypothetical protein
MLFAAIRIGSHDQPSRPELEGPGLEVDSCQGQPSREYAQMMSCVSAFRFYLSADPGADVAAQLAV